MKRRGVSFFDECILHSVSTPNQWAVAAPTGSWRMQILYQQEFSEFIRAGIGLRGMKLVLKGEPRE